ncbi:Protein of unknown function [Pseudomonas reinekei]|jgi:hypothetical protein|uniref:DUF3077 domain-containing protein n=1 Tax=Pseudomonas reinekei TaxID=395598 RepID=A0A1H0TEJ4_PSERE|nr:DUF3077 domain-containing protein [Pseudomonas reinekei]KAB0484289.1 DUF3077 domain-containing protein [Pseudomonas reinekei]OLU01131.1 DUF3077 domain-containing protein [Pseudomonas reinekei]SDP52424.1 Protein of unknown function [Pseudomonas reinekei]
MNPPANDLPDQQIDTSLTSPKGSAAAQRALDYYLKPAVSEEQVEERFFDVNRNIKSEEALVHASDLLRCAAATAFESASHLQGSNRDLAFSTVHMIDMARAMVDRSLECHQNA